MVDKADDDPYALRPMHGLHEAVFAGACVGLAVVAEDGRTLREANPHLCRLLGYVPGSLSDAPLTKLVVDRTQPLVTGIRRWRRADGSGIDLRVRLSRPDGGEEAAGIDSGALEAGRSGTELVAVLEPVDADEVARAEQNREVLAASGLGEWRWEAATGRVSLSRRAGQILGFPPGRSATWATMRERIEADDLARIREIVALALAEGHPWEFECAFRRGEDDAAIHVGARGQPILCARGHVTGMVGVVQNVTRRVEARKALREREQRLRVASSLAALGIFEWHLGGEAAVWENERMFEIFGRRPEDGVVSVTEFLESVLHPDDRKPVRHAIRQAMHEDRILRTSGRIRRHDTGSWRTVEMAGRFERDTPDGLPNRLIGVLADMTDRRNAQERQSLLIRELHHRVKNTLATVQAIVGSTARTASSIDSFYEAFVGRIKSLSHTHSVLTEDTWQTANLHALLVNELRPYAEDEMVERDGRFSLDGPAVDLPSDVAVPIGMAIHELTTNAARHGALSTRTGRISVDWTVLPGGEAGILRFAWRESGGPPVAAPSRQGFGSRLLQRVLTTQVQAEVRSEYAPDGFRLVMQAPIPGRNAALNPLV